MRAFSRVLAALDNLFHKRRVERELDEEVRAYADLVADEQMAKGATVAEARRTALADAGGLEQIKQAVRDGRAGTNAELLWQDARFGFRQLRRNPGFTITAILTLALSIGANTAIFSIVNALLLKSLPYPNADRMGTVYTRIRGKVASDERHHVNGEQWELLRDSVPALISAVSSTRASGVNLQAGTRYQYVQNERISAHYLDVLGLQPAVGRNFTEDEDRPSGPHAAILSERLRRSLFDGNRDVVGQTILLRGTPYTVIGVLPADAVTPSNADIYTALQPARTGEGMGTNFEAITRLRDGANWQEADAEINRAWLARRSRYELEEDPGAQVDYYSVPLQTGQAGKLRPQAWSLMLAAGFILLIACANLAGLTLVRMMRRTGEVATRLALGASRWQIQRQFWIESVMLALAGCAAGIGMGYLALRGLMQLLPEHYLPVTGVSLDGRVLGFAVAVSLLTSVLFGMLPAFGTRKVDLRSSIASRKLGGTRHQRVRQMLIAGEVALTVVLLAASGLLIRTLIHLETLPPGFNGDGVVTGKASLDDVRFQDPARLRELFDKSTAAMRRIPGVEAAAVGLSLPYERALNGGVMLSDGRESGQEVMSGQAYVTPEYFRALQIPILLGRSFNDGDGASAGHVAIVNRAFMSKFYHGENPVGRYVDKETRIVGVVADVMIAPGIDPVAPLAGEQMMYVPATQMDPRALALVHVWFQPSWIVRRAGSVEGLSEQMQRALATAAPNLPFSGFYSMSDLEAKTLASQRVEVALLGVMAALALLLSAVGIFALVASVAGQKRHEIGIRLALGSTVRQAMVHVGLPGLRASMWGLTVGLVLCAVCLRGMQSVLYGVQVYDASTLLAVVGVLVMVTMAATVVPTLRIAGIDPAKTLREE